MAAATRAAVSARTPGSSLTTRETVFRLTPAVLATSRIVALVATRAPLLHPVNRFSDNVVSTGAARL
jgi:hypothetical protein